MFGFEFQTLYIENFILQGATLVRVLVREHRTPSSRVAWMVLVLAVPVIGVVLYFLFGEVNFGRKLVRRMHAVNEGLLKQPRESAAAAFPIRIPVLFRQAFARASSVNGFQPCGGNSAELMDSSDAMIDALVADIDAATDHVHILFYIWLEDNNGKKVIEAVKRAAARGVTCRCLVDGMGSRALVRSQSWQDMADAGVKTGEAFCLKLLILHLFFGRVDIRNHRKIIVIDAAITYCGSQNCADAEFLVKPKFAPWVDMMVRLEGPIAWQSQHLFVSDWITHTEEDISHMLDVTVQGEPSGFTAIAVGTGPTESYQAVPDIFQNLLSSAQEEIIITTPYYVPSESLQRRICSAAIRGVTVKLILPKHNDSAIVARASRSYYLSLLQCGVQLFEYRPGLLHSKTLTIDGQISFFGSANLDRRSFDINFENCMLAMDQDLTADIRLRQHDYIAESDRVLLSEVEGWWLPKRMVHNLVATMGPLL